MNTWDIDRAMADHAKHPVLGPATRMLGVFRDTVNQNSDGWPYWTAARKAASKLMYLIEVGDTNRGRTATEAEFKKAQTPLKTFCTKHNLPFPRLDDNADFDVNAVRVALQSLVGHNGALREGLTLMVERVMTRQTGWVAKMVDDLNQVEVVLERMAAESRQLRMERYQYTCFISGNPPFGILPRIYAR